MGSWQPPSSDFYEAPHSFSGTFSLYSCPQPETLTQFHSPPYLDSLITASLGSASPAPISTALMMPTGTGQAVW